MLRSLGAGPTTIAADDSRRHPRLDRGGSRCSPSPSPSRCHPSPARSRPPGLSRFGHRLRLDGPRPRPRRPGGRPRRDRPRSLVPRGTPSRAATFESRARAELEGGAGSRVGRITATGADRRALCARTGAGPDRGAGPFGHVRGRPRGGADCGHPHLRERPAVARVASRALRVELQLPAQRQQHDAPASALPPRPRSRCRRVGRLRLHRCRDRRPRRSVSLRIRPLRDQGADQSADTCRTRGRRHATRSSSARRPWPSCTSTSATPWS